MARAVLPVCVARDDGEWTGDRHGDHLLRVGMDRNWSADPTIALKALAMESLARTRPLQLGQALIGSISINVLDGGGLNLRHSGVIRIRFRCYISSVSSERDRHIRVLRVYQHRYRPEQFLPPRGARVDDVDQQRRLVEVPAAGPGSAAEHHARALGSGLADLPV